MSGLFFVNSTPVPKFEPPHAAGIAYSDDLACVAYLGRGLEMVEFFVSENEKAFSKCPYWPLWRKNCVVYKNGEFNFSRVLLDAGRKANHVGFDQKEIDVNGDRYIPVDVDLWAPAMLRRIESGGVLTEVLGHSKKDPSSTAAMVVYFWDSLRVVDGEKTLYSATDPIEPIKAVVVALAAEEIHHEQAYGESERAAVELRRLEEEDRRRAGAWLFGTNKREKNQARLEVERQEKMARMAKEKVEDIPTYYKEHGFVQVRILANHSVRRLSLEAAMSIIYDLRAAEFHP